MDTRLIKMIELTDLEKLFKERSFAYFTKGQYNLNIIGIRNLIDGNLQDNTFNDILLVTYKDETGKWIRHLYPFSTDPGATILAKPSEAKGAAILVPGQYRSTYKIDKHKGQYDALCQRLKPVAVYRDSNKDKYLDFNPMTIDTGMFGINIHRGNANGTTSLVNGWSAGCQVFASVTDFNEFMKLVYKSAELYGNSFTYTLITSDLLSKCVC